MKCVNEVEVVRMLVVIRDMNRTTVMGFQMTATNRDIVVVVETVVVGAASAKWAVIAITSILTVMVVLVAPIKSHIDSRTTTVNQTSSNVNTNTYLMAQCVPELVQ